MKEKVLKILPVLLLFFLFIDGYCQNQVPYGISYQAVARDNYGKELVNKDIDVKFSVISPNPLGTVVYQEIHADVITSRYGVFSLVIGHGTPTEGTYDSFSKIRWSDAAHYLRVEVKIDNNFIDMGTMQFLAVPYALYAQKSLEPGPVGPKGEQGDPASDDQTLSFNGSNLSISGGNTVNLSPLNVPHQLSIAGDTLSIFGGNKVSLVNQIQDLQLDVNNKLKITKNTSATAIDLSKFLDDRQQLDFDTVSNVIAISGGNSVNLSTIRQDLMLNGNQLTITKKADPNNIDLSKYIQDLTFTPATGKLNIEGGNEVDLSALKDNTDSQQLSFTATGSKLNITGGNEVDLSALKDNTDSQQLSFTATGSKLNITGGNEVDLSALKDNTDNQQLSFNAGTNTLSLTNSVPVSLGSMVAFRAKKIISETGLILNTDYDFICPVIDYNDGSAYNGSTGIFTVPSGGIYTFIVGYNASVSGSARELKLSLNGSIYEILNSEINSGLSLTRSITLKLAVNDQVKVLYNRGTSPETGTGSFSGFKVY
jgi:hypothetical protein